MVRAWYMDDDETDQRAEHHRDPPEFLSLDELYRRTGVEYLKMDLADSDGALSKLRRDRGYTYEDELVCSRDTLGDQYDAKLRTFYSEHLHTDEEIRLVVDGSGYFDVRDGEDDRWIRIEVVAGDLLVLPSGIYHRFTLDKKDFIRARRFFVGEPVWTAHNRPADDMDCRKEYVRSVEARRGHDVST